MTTEQFLNEKLEELIKKGSNREALKTFLPAIKESFIRIGTKGPEDVVKKIGKQIIERTQAYMAERNSENELYTTAISTCIYLPSLDGSYKIKVLGGKTSDGLDVNVETKFDVASITKMFILLLTFKLAEYGYLSLDEPMAEPDGSYSGFGDFTIRDVLLMKGVLPENYDDKFKELSTIEEARKLTSNVCLVSNDKNNNKYSDLGINALALKIEKRMGKSISELLDEYILKPFGLTHTTFNPSNYNLAGNGNKMGLVHDPKTRVLGGVSGAAGIFTNADDLAQLAYEKFIVKYINYNYMRNLISKENLLSMGTIYFPNSKQSNRGIVGLYQKNLDPNKWLCPLAYGDNAFTSQGFTGAVATFDSQNGIHNSFLVGSIGDGKEAKPTGFLNNFGKYQLDMVGLSIQLFLDREYFKLLGVNEEVNKTFKI